MNPLRIVLSLAALGLAPAATAQQFVYNAGALPAQNIWTEGIVVEDLDGDGDLDIVFANGSAYGGTGTQGAQPQHLFLNNGNGTFVAAHGNLNTTNLNAKMVIGHDFDGDNDIDLMFCSGSLGFTPRLLLNNGSAVFTDVSGTHLPPLALRSFGISAGDIDNDGDLDVCISDGGTFGGIAAQARLLLNNGLGVFTDVTALRMPVDLYNCQDITMLDIDGDLDIDIALSGKGAVGKRGRLYVNDGNGFFSIASGLNEVGTGLTYEIEFGDLDGDGDFDAAVQSIVSQSEGWARNVGNNTPWTKTTFVGPAQDDNEIGLLDYDMDGDLDVFVGSLGAAERVYANNGVGNFTHMPGVVQILGDATLDIAFGDLNGDRRIDLITAQGESGIFTNKIYFNNGPPDTLPPVYKKIETPAGIGASGTQFRVQLQDQISDDGLIGVTTTFNWATYGPGATSGSGEGFHMGGGLFSGVVPTTGSETGVAVGWTARDWAGNQSFTTVTVGVVGNPWTGLGGGLAGVTGIPVLTGNGLLVGRTAGSFSLTNARPSSLTLLMISFANSPTSFKGGSVITIPIFFDLTVGTNGAGSWLLPWAAWPTGLPSGVDLFFQVLVADVAAIEDVAISTALQATLP